MSTLCRCPGGMCYLHPSLTTCGMRKEPIQRTVEREAAMVLGGKLLFSYRLVARAAAVATVRELGRALGPNDIINQRLAEFLGDKVLVEQALCAHEDLTGGNDYQSCNTCRFEWDYRKTTPAQHLFELITQLLKLEMQSAGSLIELSQDDVVRLTVLLENAEAEVDAAADPEATVLPDDAGKLMSSYNWSKGLRARLKNLVEG